MEVLILTRSDKHKADDGGYCVAGINLQNNQWIRLVGPHYHFKIADAEAIYENGTLCEPFDVVEVDAEKIDSQKRIECNAHGWGNGFTEQYPENLLSIQPENYIVRDKFKLVRKASIDEVMHLGIVSDDAYIYKDDTTSLSIEDAIECNKSLVMIKVEDLELYPKEKYDEDGYQAHYRARFKYKGHQYDGLSVTDPDYDAAKTDFQGLKFGETYLIMSVGEEYRERHYKIIAKIFETVYTIENNTYGFFHAFSDCKYLEKYKDSVIYALWDDMVADGMGQCKECAKKIGSSDDHFERKH